MPGRLLEILEVDGRPDSLHVAAQEAARKVRRNEQAAPGSGRNRVVHRVVSVGGRDVAGADSRQRIRPSHAAEVDVLEIAVGGWSLRLDVRDFESVSDPEPGETAPQRVAGGNRSAFAVLRVV